MTTAEDSGNVTGAHYKLLACLTGAEDWCSRALWACLEELRYSVITAAAEVRVEWAWTDGPDAFCVIYSPPYQPGHRVGIRREAYDGDVVLAYGMGSTLFRDKWHGEDDPTGKANPIAFGVAVAAFDIGEPLGSTIDQLRVAPNGVGWWGSLGTKLPATPSGWC